MEQDDSFMRNFGMIIPKQAYKIEERIEDPLGVPIYAGCPAAGLCACTGRCRMIIGHTSDPERLATYREEIRKHNEFLKAGGMQKIYGHRTWDDNSEQINRMQPPTE